MAEHLLLGQPEHRRRPHGGCLRAHPDHHQPSTDGEAIQRLLEGDFQADGVEGDVESAPAGDLTDPVPQVGIAGIEGVVGTQFQGALANLRVDVHRDDRGSANQSRQLHNVGSDTADSPYPDRFADADLAGAHHRAVGRGHRVGQDGGLLQWHVVGNPGQAGRQGHRVLRPGAVIGERHQLGSQAVAEVTAPAVRAVPARPAGSHHHPVPLGPAGDARAEPGDRAGGLMALGDHRPLRGERAVDQADVGVADAAERHLDQNLARAGLGDRNILEHNGLRVGVETFGAHRPGSGLCHRVLRFGDQPTPAG